VTLVADPDVEWVHIMLMEHDDKDIESDDYRVNVYDEQVKMECIKQAWGDSK
jgi:hypothetical protein